MNRDSDGASVTFEVDQSSPGSTDSVPGSRESDLARIWLVTRSGTTIYPALPKPT